MWMRFDNGRFRRFNYNRVVAQGRKACCSNNMRPEPMTQRKAWRTFQVLQDINWIYEPQIAIRRSNDGTRRGFI